MLHHEADLLSPEVRELTGRKLGDLFPLEKIGTTCRLAHTAQNIQKRRFSTAALSGDSQKLSPLHLHIYAAQRMNDPIPLAIRHVDFL